MFYVLAVVFSLLSSLRIFFLPEIQFLIVFLILSYTRKINHEVFFLVITIFCTHHFAVPDVEFRFASTAYPSIYTKSYFGFKILDVLAVLLFVFSLPRIREIRLLISKQYPVLLLFLSCLGIVHLNQETFASANPLFLARSYLIILSVFLASNRLSKANLIMAAKIAIASWSSKMFFAILFPHDSPVIREVGGIQGTLYFAGDEYLTLGFYFAAIFLLSSRIKYIPYFFIINSILMLPLIANRRGSIPYFFVINVMLVISLFFKSRIVNTAFNFLLIISLFATFIFLYVGGLHSDFVRLFFIEYVVLTDSAMASIYALPFFNKMFGITPFGKYEIKEIHAAFDGAMAFGPDAGKTYRYMLFGIPGGRLVLNVGLVGMLYYIGFLIKKALRTSSCYFYLLIATLPFFFAPMITPVEAISIGFSLSVLNHYRRLQR